MKGYLVLLIIVLIFIGAIYFGSSGPNNEANVNISMQITSSVFEPNGLIPSKYTCDGENINPELIFSQIPENTVSLALIMEDPDVPKTVRPDGMWNHWVVWNIKPEVTGIKEASEPNGIIGVNTGGKTAYQGPCPPDKEHRYFFKLFALDTELSLEPGSTKAELERAMSSHIIEQAQLIGRYDRS